MIAHQVCRNKFAKSKGIARERISPVSYKERMSVHFNSNEVKLYALSGSRSVENVVVYIPEFKVVLLGDIVISDSFPVINNGNGESIKSLINSLEQIMGMFPDDVKLCPPHGKEFTMNELKAYHKMIVKTFNEVSNQYRMGVSLTELIAKDFLGNWKAWDDKKYHHINRGYWIKTIYGELKV